MDRINAPFPEEKYVRIVSRELIRVLITMNEEVTRKLHPAKEYPCQCGFYPYYIVNVPMVTVSYHRGIILIITELI
jgi:hypothetical protein